MARKPEDYIPWTIVTDPMLAILFVENYYGKAKFQEPVTVFAGDRIKTRGNLLYVLRSQKVERNFLVPECYVGRIGGQ